MSRLNAPRTCSFEFRYTVVDDVVYVFDNSARTHICSSTPTIFARPVCLEDGDLVEDTAGDYWGETIMLHGSFPVPMHDDEVEPGADESTAWLLAMDRVAAQY